LDLSGTLAGAGGIGGLLARSRHATTSPYGINGTSYYHADGNGNVTYLASGSGGPDGAYRYDPFGRWLAQTGSYAGANGMRFSSKPWLAHNGSNTEGLYYYGYRFYDPLTQRWLNRDPLGENGGINLYGFVVNDPINSLDSDGRGIMRDIGKGIAGPGRLCTEKSCNKDKCKDKAKALPEEGWEDDVKNKKDPWKDIPDPGKCMDVDMVATAKGTLQIHNGTTCTIRCDKDGNPKDIICKKRWRFSPDPTPNPTDPGLPASPFPK
jgi:RHS repeat-associated protein